MSDEPHFLSVRQVRAVHRRSIEDHGGDAGLRDPAMLEAAVGMPAARFDGELLHPTIPAMAAAYLFHLCMNHPFVDGNKRTAFATAEIFLDVNGYALEATDDEAYEVTMEVAASRRSKAETVEFFEAHSNRRR